MPHQPKHPKKILSVAERVRPIAGQHVVDIHSENGHLMINGQRGTAADLAAMIKHDPAWRPGQPVVLMSCDTGGPESVAAAVAKHLDTTVTAPDHLAWSSPHDGHIWSASYDPHTGSTTWPPDGMFLDHHPDGTTTPSALNDHDTVHPAAPDSDAAVDHPLPDDPHGHGQAPEDAIHRGAAGDHTGETPHQPVPIKYPEGYKPLQLSPHNSDGTIETRQLRGNGVFEVERTASHERLNVRGMIHNEDVAFNRRDARLGKLDGYDRKWFNRQDGDMLAARNIYPSKMAAGHLVSVQAAGTAYDRILMPSFDVRTEIAGQHADMAKLVDTVREVMASHPETKGGLPLWHPDWARQHLSPRELKEILELINDERRINFVPQLGSVNSGAYRSTFEQEVFTDADMQNRWRTFDITLKYDTHSNIPSEISARYEWVDTDDAREGEAHSAGPVGDGYDGVKRVPWTHYPNNPENLERFRNAKRK